MDQASRDWTELGRGSLSLASDCLPALGGWGWYKVRRGRMGGAMIIGPPYQEEDAPGPKVREARKGQRSAWLRGAQLWSWAARQSDNSLGRRT